MKCDMYLSHMKFFFNWGGGGIRNFLEFFKHCGKHFKMPHAYFSSIKIPNIFYANIQLKQCMKFY